MDFPLLPVYAYNQILMVYIVILYTDIYYIFYSLITTFLGGLADDHDVFQFLTTSLYPPGQLPLDRHKVSLEEQAKLNQEYLDYQKKLDEQKEEYRK